MKADGRYHAGFSPGFYEGALSADTPRVAFRSREDRSILLGALVTAKRRNSGLAAALFAHTMNMLLSEGRPVVGTGIIRKPIIALVLSRMGFTPDSDSAIAQILPVSGVSPEEVPRVVWVKDAVPPAERINCSNGRFYHEISSIAASTLCPVYLDERTQVALHTTYTAPDSFDGAN